MVGLGRVELPTNGLGIGRLFLNLYVFSTFSLVDFVLFWAHSEAERATDHATSALRLTFIYPHPITARTDAPRPQWPYQAILGLEQTEEQPLTCL
jgi:hypothetical protein